MPDSKPGLMTIFTEALARTEPTERAAYLDAACGDSELRQRVEKLLTAHSGIGRFLEPEAPVSQRPDATAAFSPVAATADLPGGKETGAHTWDGATGTFHDAPVGQEHPAAAGLGTVIAGRYILVKLIGEGGMGSVYQVPSRPSRSSDRWALQVDQGRDGLKGGAGTVRRREAGAAALMDHPNIARVYDGGATGAGQPFFVMELVQGVPLTDYCDSKRLTVDARLQLFVSVCQAVQHAHQKGIIHRDLKPGNILVAAIDGKPTPKVIDFGVAKATEQRLTGHELRGHCKGDYRAALRRTASPEQADPSSMGHRHADRRVRAGRHPLRVAHRVTADRCLAVQARGRPGNAAHGPRG